MALSPKVIKSTRPFQVFTRGWTKLPSSHRIQLMPWSNFILLNFQNLQTVCAGEWILARSMNPGGSGSGIYDPYARRCALTIYKIIWILYHCSNKYRSPGQLAVWDANTWLYMYTQPREMGNTRSSAPRLEPVVRNKCTVYIYVLYIIQRRQPISFPQYILTFFYCTFISDVEGHTSCNEPFMIYHNHLCGCTSSWWYIAPRLL